METAPETEEVAWGSRGTYTPYMKTYYETNKEAIIAKRKAYRKEYYQRNREVLMQEQTLRNARRRELRDAERAKLIVT